MFDDFVAWSIFLVDRDLGVVVKVGQQAGLTLAQVRMSTHTILLCIKSSFDMHICISAISP